MTNSSNYEREEPLLLCFGVNEEMGRRFHSLCKEKKINSSQLLEGWIDGFLKEQEEKHTPSA